MRAQSKAKIMANACKIKIFEAAIAGWYRVGIPTGYSVSEISSSRRILPVLDLARSTGTRSSTVLLVSWLLLQFTSTVLLG